MCIYVYIYIYIYIYIYREREREREREIHHVWCAAICPMKHAHRQWGEFTHYLRSLGFEPQTSCI